MAIAVIKIAFNSLKAKVGWQLLAFNELRSNPLLQQSDSLKNDLRKNKCRYYSL